MPTTGLVRLMFYSEVWFSEENSLVILIPVKVILISNFFTSLLRNVRSVKRIPPNTAMNFIKAIISILPPPVMNYTNVILVGGKQESTLQK